MAQPSGDEGDQPFTVPPLLPQVADMTIGATADQAYPIKIPTELGLRYGAKVRNQLEMKLPIASLQIAPA